MSWIERDDLVRLIAHIVATPQLTGAVNGTAPAPVRNAAFAQELGRALHRPALLRMPAFLLHHLAGDLADELLLGGRRVLPDKAEASGFKFRHETLPSAFSAMLGSEPAGDLGRGFAEMRDDGKRTPADGSAAERLNETRGRSPSACGLAPAENLVEEPAVEPAVDRLRSARWIADARCGARSASVVSMSGGNAEASDGPPDRPGSRRPARPGARSS